MLKNVSAIAVVAAAEITVVESGGDLTIDGVHVIAHDRAAPEPTAGHTYVLYLKALPESSSFRGWPRIDMSGDHPDPLFDPRDPSVLREFCRTVSKDAFLAAVHNSAR